MARRDDLEGRIEEHKEIMNRPENLRIRDQGPRNADMLLVAVKVTNDEDCIVMIERDQRYDAYVTQWRGPMRLAPLRYPLYPGKSVLLPNQYVTFSGVGKPKGCPLKLRLSFGRAKN